MVSVYLFVPNLIGYARVACTLAFLYLARDRASWHVALSSYIVSFALDLFDGMAARRFHQTSRFGAVEAVVRDDSAQIIATFAGEAQKRGDAAVKRLVQRDRHDVDRLAARRVAAAEAPLSVLCPVRVAGHVPDLRRERGVGPVHLAPAPVPTIIAGTLGRMQPRCQQ